MSSGAGAGKRRARVGWTSWVLDVDDRQVVPVEPRTQARAVVIAAIGAASVSMNPIRAAGNAGSIGR